MKRNFKDRLSLLGLDYRKEIAIMIAIFLLFGGGGVALYFITHEIYVSLIVGFMGIALPIFYFTRYSKLEKAQEMNHIDEFVSLLSYFKIFISNKNNVYNSLKMLLPYSSPFLQENLQILLDSIDSDKSVGPYVSFANKFHSHVIESLMLSIYQMVDTGANENGFNEFDVLFNNIRAKYNDELIDKNKKSLDTLNSFPLIGAGALTIILSVSILQIVGEMVNVL